MAKDETTICQSSLFNVTGYTLDYAVCTTMSMDAGAAMKTVVQALHPEMKKVSMELKRILVGAKDKFAFFYDEKSGINYSDYKADIRLSAYIESFSHAVKAKKVFHPKITLARFINNSDAGHVYRLQVSSKNITSSNSFETGVQLRSVPKNKTPNHNLCKFIEILNEAIENKTTKAKLKDICKDLEKLSFVLVEDKDNETDKVHITVSGEELGTTQKELIDALKQPCKMIILSPDYETAQDKLADYHVYAPVGVATHAKLYYKTDTKTLWIGSSNLSEAGMGKNIECMVRIKDACGIDISDLEKTVVFGTECTRITESKIPNNSFSCSKKLNEFINAHNFSIEDDVDGNGFFYPYITITQKTNYTLPQELTIYLLPAGMSEFSRSNHSKWIDYSKGKDVKKGEKEFHFKGSKPESKTGSCGIIRIKAEYKGETAEQRIIPNKEKINAAITALQNELLDSFLKTPWLNKIKKVENGYSEAVQMYDAVSKLDLNDAQKEAVEQVWKYIQHYTGNKQTSPKISLAVSDVITKTLVSGNSNNTNTGNFPKFQQDAIDAACDAFKNGRTKFLVADEAGLGKTYIARGVIEKIYSTKNHSKPFIVYYFGSNAYLLDNTLKKLTNENTDYNIISGIDRLGLVSATLKENSLPLNRINLFGFSANLLVGGGSKVEMDSYGKYYDQNINNNNGIPLEIRNIFNRWYKNETINEFEIQKVRKIFEKLSIKSFRPDLIITDEFHRYAKVMDNISELAGDVPILMLSATPYLIYKTNWLNDDSEKKLKYSEIADDDSENKSDSAFKSFEDLLNYLGGNALKKKYDQLISDWNKENIDELSGELRKYMWRNERVYGIEDKYRDLPLPEDWLSGKYDDCIDNAVNPSEPARFFSLCSGVYSFPVKVYKPEKDIEQDFYENMNLQDLCNSEGEQLNPDNFIFTESGSLNGNYLENNIRLKLINDYQVKEGKNLLWVPASQPFYKVNGVFSKNALYTKLLVFSGYKLVPRMISSVFSEAVRPVSNTSGKKQITLKSSFDEEMLNILAGLYEPSVCDLTAEELIKETAAKVKKESFDKEPEIIAMYSIASPVVCAYRLTKDCRKAGEIAEAFNQYFNKTDVRSALERMEINDEPKLLKYCVDGNLMAVLTEFMFCTGPHKFAEQLCAALGYGGSTMHVYCPDGKGGYKAEEKDCLFADRFSPDRLDNGGSDTSQAGKKHQKTVETAFNSPFWPMILCTTSVGQEGIDFDRYSSRIMHFSLPSNPMSFEQRDGRVDRRRSLLARRKMAAMWVYTGKDYENYWEIIFSQGGDDSGLSPDWVQQKDNTDLKQERIIPFFPLSSEYIYYKELLNCKYLYRGKMGVPNEKILNDKNVTPLKLNNIE